MTTKRSTNDSGSAAAAAHSTRAALEGRGYVWRISEQAPQGEWVKRGTSRATQPPSGEPPMRDANWAMSSWDLLTGVTVVEVSGAKQDELLREFFARSSSRHGK